MKITFEETLNSNEWLHKELLNSLTHNIISEARELRSYEVKLLVNGHELEPALFTKIFNNMETHIDKEAEILLNDKISDALIEVDILHDVVSEAAGKIRDKFNITEDE